MKLENAMQSWIMCLFYSELTEPDVEFLKCRYITESTFRTWQGWNYLHQNNGVMDTIDVIGVKVNLQVEDVKIFVRTHTLMF